VWAGRGEKPPAPPRCGSPVAGGARRFSTISQADVFRRALTTHCHEASMIVEQFSGEWFSKTNYQQGGISREDASNFSYGAMCKLAAELKEGAREDG